MGNGGTGYATYIAGGADAPGHDRHDQDLAVDHLVMCSAFNNMGKSAAQFTADAKAIIDAVIAVRPNCTFTVCFEPYLTTAQHARADDDVDYKARLDIVAYAKTKTDGHLFNMYKSLRRHGHVETVLVPYRSTRCTPTTSPTTSSAPNSRRNCSPRRRRIPVRASGLNPFEGDVDFDQHAVKNAKGTTLLPQVVMARHRSGHGHGTAPGELAVIEEVNRG